MERASKSGTDIILKGVSKLTGKDALLQRDILNHRLNHHVCTLQFQGGSHNQKSLITTV